MMTPKDFKEAWECDGDELTMFAPAVVGTLKIPEEQRQFLIDPGLPKSAAPYLDFGGKLYLTIPTASELWKLSPAFSRYRVFGSNGFGDPICLDEDTAGTVVYLNHDNEMKRGFINSNLQCLARSLLAFRQVVQGTQKRGGSDAYLNGQIPNDIADQFILKMDEIDPDAIKPESFWFRSIMTDGI